MAYGVDLLYETNERGEQVLVKSLESTRRAFLRFYNSTSRPVNICWRDYQGARRHYMRLEPGRSFDINTYQTHPWEFTDAATGERFVINNKTIFRAPVNTGILRVRTQCYICVPMRTLKHIALLTLALQLPNVRATADLGLPRLLNNDLRELVTKLTDRTQQRID